MSGTMRTMAVLDETQPASSGDTSAPHPQLNIHVSRRGEPGNKELRFTVQNFTIVDKMHVYGIRHLLGFEETVDSVAIYNGSGDIFVTFEHWQLINEPLVNKLAKTIGDALHFAPGHVKVTIDDNVL